MSDDRSNSAQSGSGRVDRRRTIIKYSILLTFIAIVGVIDMPATFWPGDPFAWREEARAIIDHHQLAADPSIVPFVGEKGQAFVLNEQNLQIYSKFGIMNSLMSVPSMWVDKLLHGSKKPLISPDLLITNLWNVLLSVLLAGVLLAIASSYTSRIATQVLFVLTSIYTTFLWYYLRAQSSEIYQTLFFSAAFLMLSRYGLNPNTSPSQLRKLYFSCLLIGMLVFTRMIYFELVPLIVIFVGIALIRIERPRRLGMALRLLPHVFAPPLVILGLLGWVNDVKFGSPWLTGYHQWRPEQHLPVGSMAEGLYGLLLHPRFSIFLNFPLLLVALAGLWKFIRRFPMDAIIAWGTAGAFILLLSKIPSWSGEWTYGPRYVLFLLPVLSVPSICVFDWLIDQRRNVLAMIGAALIAMILGYSTYLQIRVNQIGFFAYYDMRMAMDPGWPPEVEDYFLNHHAGVITAVALQNRNHLDDLPWFARMMQQLPESRFQELRAKIEKILNQSNHYWTATLPAEHSQ